MKKKLTEEIKKQNIHEWKVSKLIEKNKINIDEEAGRNTLVNTKKNQSNKKIIEVKLNKK